MALTDTQVLKNYHKCTEFVSGLLEHERRQKGFYVDEGTQQNKDMVQTITGDENVVFMLQNIPFSQEVYEPVLLKAMTDIQKQLFPDTAKKQFVSIHVSGTENILPQPEAADIHKTESLFSREAILCHIQKHLDEQAFYYLKNKLLSGIPEWEKNLSFLLKKRDQQSEIKQVIQTVSLLQQFFPDGNIEFSENFNPAGRLTRKEIVRLFILVYAGIEKRFPENFLKEGAKKKAAVIIRCLIDDILYTSPKKILAEGDEFIFLKHHVQNIYRLFNYSINRVLNNAYPDIIMPWDNSRSQNAYWEKQENRRDAIRWLVEDRLKFDPAQLYKKSLSKKDFSRNGLSYLFNQYYNSVAKALAEAYPHMHPWELGKVPFSYWNPENTVTAIRWLVGKMGWQAEELAEKAASGELNRKTFSQMGLATLFEKKFAKNLYRALSLAYPGRFEPWEFGKVSSQYWQNPQNIYHASRWVAQKEGFDEKEVIHGIRKGKLDFRILQRYSIGRVLKKLSRGNIERLFTPVFWREHQAFLKEQRLQKKLNALKNKERRKGILSLILNGFFTGEALLKDNISHKRYNKIARRIKRRSAIYTEKESC